MLVSANPSTGQHESNQGAPKVAQCEGTVTTWRTPSGNRVTTSRLCGAVRSILPMPPGRVCPDLGPTEPNQTAARRFRFALALPSAHQSQRPCATTRNPQADSSHGPLDHVFGSGLASIG